MSSRAAPGIVPDHSTSCRTAARSTISSTATTRPVSSAATIQPAGGDSGWPGRSQRASRLEAEQAVGAEIDDRLQPGDEVLLGHRLGELSARLQPGQQLGRHLRPVDGRAATTGGLRGVHGDVGVAQQLRRRSVAVGAATPMLALTSRSSRPPRMTGSCKRAAARRAPPAPLADDDANSSPPSRHHEVVLAADVGEPALTASSSSSPASWPERVVRRA
jgi:hypothetical protein